MALHHGDVVACPHKLVLPRHVCFAVILADPGGDPQRVTREGGALVFHVMLAGHAAETQFNKAFKRQAQVAGMKRRDGLHPHQVNGVVGVAKFVQVFGLNGQLPDKLGRAVPHTRCSVGQLDGGQVDVFENVGVAHVAMNSGAWHLRFD